MLQIDDHRRRSSAGQFQANALIELFLVFGARKTTFDAQERLADEFTRLDFIEATSDPSFTDEFFEVLQFLTQMDLAFGRYVRPKDSDIEPSTQSGESDEMQYLDEPKRGRKEGRFRDGIDLFGSNPARVGFVAALAEKILGRPGMEWSPEKHRERRDTVRPKMSGLLKRLEHMDPKELGDFLDFDTLNQVISAPAAKVGEYERNFFKTAFAVLIEEGPELTSLTPCWRAP